MKLLNLGCGNRYLTDNWTNLDFISPGRDVLSCNLLNGIPYPDNTFDVVYHSHLLEHFPKERAPFFMQECYRVLKPSGVLRIAIPDLEQIAKLYLQKLQLVWEDRSPLNKANYEWAVMELYDQTVRHKSGGAMSSYWSQPALVNEQWIEQRMGNEFVTARKSLLHRAKTMKKSQKSPNQWKKYFQLEGYRHKLLKWISGEPRLFEYLALGKFRLGGEIHQWMYDRYSVTDLMQTAGFETTRQMEADTSMIPEWKQYQWLDIENGKVRKPDSLFMEGRK